ncbi:DExH-box ATP-dependent RNA helicase DExH7, chloroplastic [Glycine soja]
MAPKKNKQKAKAQSGPKLQISAENENRLRRLLLNSARPTTATAADDTLTKAQKAKKLKAVYEKLSCEGFGNHQIELSLSALREAATFESALDWLCLNLPGNELPLKFSTGISHYDQGGSVGVISNQPAVDAASITIEEEAPESPVLIRRQWKNDDTLDSRLTSQADWIRQYVEQQEEDESESWEDDIFFDGRSAKHKPCEPRSYDVIAKEYLAARLEATKAKEKRDKNRQEQAGHIIRKLKQELSALGLSDDSLALEHEHEISYTFKSERASTGPEAVDCFKEKTPCDTEGLASGKTEVAESDVESHSMVEHLVKSGSPVVHVEKDSAQGEVGDIELGGLFLEDASPSEILPPDILKVQKQEKIRRLSEKNLDKLDGIWKKGDPQKIPKAVLHQLCQKSGWEAPKFDKILGRGKIFSYTVSILRKASGRGKNRKAGGLVTLQLPDQNETVESAENIDWGPKPFKVFDGWLNSKEYQRVVRDCWSAFQPTGWGGIVLKNKLKILKHRLKMWSNNNTADLCSQQAKQLKKVQSELWEKANLHESIMRQKSRSKWIKEGDRNSLYFHKLINYSRRRNALRGLMIDGAWVEDPLLVKAEVLKHFQNRFHEPHPHRPNLDGISFSALTPSQRDILDAQNKVAAYALYKLFPDIPVHLPITEPYTLLIMKWMEGESSTNLEDSEKNHRSGFVDSLLNDNSSAATASVDVTDYKCLQNIGRLQENRNSTIACHQQFSQRETYIKERESADLRQAQHSKMRTQRYQTLHLLQDMLNIRATLPIAALKGDILKLMEEHDFLVVCGETGSGKTTQVPQFILDDMIESGHGGYCNIICTQPRRIAAVSVAERVADERCEPSPGSDGSLIGYQVRLDSARIVWRLLRDRLPTKANLSRRQVEIHDQTCPFCRSTVEDAAHLFFQCSKTIPLWWEAMSWVNISTVFPQHPRHHFAQHMTDGVKGIWDSRWRVWWVALTWNEKTRLLFCTTGILLRKLMGDQSLSGITHIIVDEVHERSLLGDFLLIVLKNLIEKQSTNSSGKLKIILMSATVDSSLFSRYFNNCPVVTAEGRTHPVTTYFLEDIYDQIEYRLASDSPASLTDGTFPKGQILQRDVVTNSRGKKNLVLSAWGDESLLSEEHFNPYFVPSYYQLYSEQTRQNMKRLNEDVIDYDLLEDLICFIDETCDEGAILGMSEINYLHDKLVASSQFGGPSSEWVIPLHSAVASSEQKREIYVRIVFSNDSFNGHKLMEDALFLCRTWLNNLEKGFDTPLHQQYQGRVTIALHRVGLTRPNPTRSPDFLDTSSLKFRLVDEQLHSFYENIIIESSLQTILIFYPFEANEAVTIALFVPCFRYENLPHLPPFLENLPQVFLADVIRKTEASSIVIIFRDILSVLTPSYTFSCLCSSLPPATDLGPLALLKLSVISSLVISLIISCRKPGNPSPTSSLNLTVVIATNIAETSITIDDVIYVIDCGKHKENRYNPQKKLSSMVEDWISRANATQRRGRAGRVKPGICFSLYTRHRFEKLMRPYQVPEMLRMPLVELCLQIKLLSLGYIKPFLSEALEPPKVEAMDSAISLLYEVGALEGDEELTPLGHHLAKLPVDVLIGKMMLYGAMFGCLSPILSVAAFLSYKSPFVYPKDERQNVERAKLTLLNDKLDGPGNTNDIDRQSDHLLMMTAYKRWERILTEKGAKAAQKFCNSFFLSCSVMFMIREMRVQFGTLLADIGLITLPKDYQKNAKKIASLDSWLSDVSQPFNIYAHHSSILKAILCAGLYPNVAAGEQGIVAAVLSSLKQSSSSASSGRTVWFDGRREVHIHPSSINNNSKGFQYPFLVFLEKVETNKVFLRDTSVISPYSILLFGGSIDVLHQTGQLIIDGWLKLTAPAQIAVLFKELRLALHSILKELIRKPENATVLNNEIIKSIITLLLEEGSIPQ